MDAKSGKPASGQLQKALQSGLLGRRALLRAYEGVSERTNDLQLKETLASFAQDERREYDRAVEITRAHGGDPGAVHNVKEEVAAFLSKAVLMGGEEPYSAARDVAMLHGLEAAGQAGALFLREVARGADDEQWVSTIDESIDLAGRHMEYLQQQAEALGRSAFRG